jgi:hypothetical protein
MGFLRKILGSLIVAAILSASVAYVVDGRFLNFKYIETKANTSQFYPDLARALPATVAPQGGSKLADEQLANAINADVLQVRLGDFMDQLQAYYRQDGQAPTLDLRDIAIQARSAGLVVPPDTALDKPIVFNDPTGLKAQYKNAHAAMIYGPMIAAILLLLMMITLPSPARYRSAGKTLIAAALSVGILWGVAQFLPGLVKSLVNANVDIAPIAPTVNNLVEAIGHDAAGDFFKIVVGLLLLAAGFFLFSLFGHKIGRSGGHEIKPKRPTPQTRPRLG